MTRHNLDQHLHWFLGSAPTEPQQPVYAPPPTSFTEDAPPLPQEVERLRPATIVRESDGNVDRSARQPEFVRPTTPASVLNNQGGYEMARLQSGPKSSKKPLLLSEHIPVALQTPNSTSTRKQGTSLKDQYSAKWESRPLGMEG